MRPYARRYARQSEAEGGRECVCGGSTLAGRCTLRRLGFAADRHAAAPAQLPALRCPFSPHRARSPDLWLQPRRAGSSSTAERARGSERKRAGCEKARHRDEYNESTAGRNRGQREREREREREQLCVCVCLPECVYIKNSAISLSLSLSLSLS
eukprot:COSAG03_NODE_664_length_6384_cov_118.079236_9_plen_153_part_01